MMYILTEEEMQALKSDQRSIQLENKKKLQALCTKIANEMPVKWGWGEKPDPKPWGCVLSTREEWYCDSCPVQEICPSNRKTYSQ